MNPHTFLFLLYYNKIQLAYLCIHIKLAIYNPILSCRYKLQLMSRPVQFYFLLIKVNVSIVWCFFLIELACLGLSESVREVFF